MDNSSSKFNPNLVSKFWKDDNPQFVFEENSSNLRRSTDIIGSLGLKSKPSGIVDNGIQRNLSKFESKLINIEGPSKKKKFTTRSFLKEKFTDVNFPPNNQSLLGLNSSNKYIDSDVEEEMKFNCINSENVEWKRLPDIFPLYEVFDGYITHTDVKQGSLGNCYFLSVLAALCTKSYLIYQLFRIKKRNFEGYYEVVFYLNGIWQVVVLDDYFPVFKGTNKLCFAAPEGFAVWVLLLEKAWAKVNSGYMNTIGGNPSEPLQALTGFSTECLFHNKIKDEKLWMNIKSADDTNKIICASTSPNVEFNNGLISGHAYTLVDAKVIKGFDSPKKINKESAMIVRDKELMLLKLRNPWGQAAWDGEWSSTSKNWTSEIKQEIDYSEGDGVFYCTFDEFFKFFEATFICHVMYNSKIICYHLDNDEHFSYPIAFNIYLEENSKLALSVLFRSWRFDRKLKGAFRPFSIIVAGYNLKREVHYMDGSWSSMESLEFVKELPKGFYCVIIYCAFEVFTQDLPLEYVFRICCDNHFVSKFVGIDKRFQLIQYLIVSYTKLSNIEKLESCDSFYIAYQEFLTEAGISCLVAINKTDNKLLRIQMVNLEVVNLKMLPPFANCQESTITKVPPRRGLAFIGFRLNYEEIMFNLKTKQKLIEYDLDYEEERFNELLLVEIPEESIEIDIKTFVYTFSSEVKATKPIFHSNLNNEGDLFEEIDLADLIEDNISTMAILQMIPQSSDEEILFKNEELFWTRKEFELGDYYGIVSRATRQLCYRGSFIWLTGEAYIGNWKENNFDGFGHLYDNNNKLIYEGHFEKGLKKGTGKLYFEDGNIYVGEFDNDLMNGRGVYIWKGNKQKWEGMFFNNYKHGKGKLFINNVETDEIEYDKDKPLNTKMRFSDCSSKKLVVEVEELVLNEDDKLKAKFQKLKEKDEFACRNFLKIYELENNKNIQIPETTKSKGKTKMTYVNLTKSNATVDMRLLEYGFYFGELNANNSFNGKGVYFNEKNKEAYYVGCFKNGVKEGYGEHYDKQGNLIYKGNFEDGYYHGNGVIYFSNCDWYSGEFASNQRQGEGVYYWANGSNWVGFFIRNKMHGKGKYFYANSPFTEIVGFESNVPITRSKLVDESRLSEEDEAIIDILKMKFPYIAKRLLSLPPLKCVSSLRWIEEKTDEDDYYYGQVNELGEYHGKGCYVLNKRVSQIKFYVGYWNENLKNILGFYLSSEGKVIYEGEFSDDHMHGKGRYYYTEKTFYDGEFAHNKKHGKGVYSWNINRWEGEFNYDKFDGKGMLIYDSYKISEIVEYDQGNLINKTTPIVNTSRQQRNKIIKKINELSLSCEKEMQLLLEISPTVDNTCLSWGELKFKYGDYIGEINFLKNPQGRGVIFIHSSKMYYIGYWQNGAREGKGKLYHEDWVLHYEGNFHLDKMMGWGRYFVRDSKSFYEGVYDEMGNGEGLYAWNDGHYWKGRFLYFQLDGTGIYYDPDGSKLCKIIYQNGIKLETQPV